MNRQEDLSKVFDRTWAANHNDVAKRGRERERAFMDKMFKTNTCAKKEIKIVTPDMKVEDLQRNITNASNFQKQNNLNNMKSKWK